MERARAVAAAVEAQARTPSVLTQKSLLRCPLLEKARPERLPATTNAQLGATARMASIVAGQVPLTPATPSDRRGAEANPELASLFTQDVMIA